MRIPFSEWMPDQADLGNPGALVARNVIPGETSYLPLPSPIPISSALESEPLGMFSSFNGTGVAFNFVGDAGKLYSLTASTYNDVSAYPYNSAEGDYWEFVRWGNTVIATNFADPVQQIELGAPNFEDLPGEPPKARHIAVVRDFVVLGHIDDGNIRTSRVVWSGINNETAWVPSAATQSDFQDLQGNGGNIQAIIGGEYGVVFQEFAIWRMTYVGSPLVFQFDEVEVDNGTPAPRSVVAIGNRIFYLGRDGFYVFNGSQSQSISEGKISRTFFSDIDESLIDQVVSTIDPFNAVVIWAYHGAGHTGLRNKLIIYNWQTGKWSHADITVYDIRYTRSPSFSLEDLDEISTNIDELPASLDSRLYKGGALILSGFNRDRKLVSFTGPALPAEVQTQEVQLSPGRRSVVNSVRPIIDGPCTVSVGRRATQTGSVSNTQHNAPDFDGMVWMRSNSRYHRFTVRTTGDFKHLQGVEVDFVPEGKR